MANEVAFVIGGIRFTAIRRTHPLPHWAFRTDENGVIHDAGTGGVTGVSVPKMKSCLQELFDRISKGDTADFRKRWGLPPS